MKKNYAFSIFDQNSNLLISNWRLGLSIKLPPNYPGTDLVLLGIQNIKDYTGPYSKYLENHKETLLRIYLYAEEINLYKDGLNKMLRYPKLFFIAIISQESNSVRIYLHKLDDDINVTFF